MQNFLFSIDVAVFYFVNHNLQNALFDWLMPLITDQRNWFPLFLGAYVWLWWKGGKNGRVAAVLIIFVIAMSDQVSSHVLKPFFQRPRPCVALPDVNMITGLNRSFSFPSSHATNSFAAAALLAHYFSGWSWTVYTLAFFSGFSRIYLGVHYPSDVLGGALLGLFCAWLVIRVYNFAEKIYQDRKAKRAAPQDTTELRE
jgi:undecaprenyl-diphosphatase